MAQTEMTVSPKGTPLDLGHRVVHLRLDIGAMATLQEAAKSVDMRDVETWIADHIPLKANTTRLDLNALMTIACAMGANNDPPLVRSELAQLEIAKMPDLGLAVAKGFVSSMPVPQPPSEGEKSSPPSARKPG